MVNVAVYYTLHVVLLCVAHCDYYAYVHWCYYLAVRLRSFTA